MQNQRTDITTIETIKGAQGGPGCFWFLMVSYRYIPPGQIWLIVFLWFLMQQEIISYQADATLMISGHGANTCSYRRSAGGVQAECRRSAGGVGLRPAATGGVEHSRHSACGCMVLAHSAYIPPNMRGASHGGPAFSHRRNSLRLQAESLRLHSASTPPTAAAIHAHSAVLH